MELREPESEMLRRAVTVGIVLLAFVLVALTGWGPAREGTPVQDALDALLRGLGLSGVLSARLKEVADAVEPELPELSRASRTPGSSRATPALSTSRRTGCRSWTRLPGLASLSPPECPDMASSWLP